MARTLASRTSPRTMMIQRLLLQQPQFGESRLAALSHSLANRMRVLPYELSPQTCCHPATSPRFTQDVGYSDSAVQCQAACTPVSALVRSALGVKSTV